MFTIDIYEHYRNDRRLKLSLIEFIRFFDLPSFTALFLKPVSRRSQLFVFEYNLYSTFKTISVVSRSIKLPISHTFRPFKYRSFIRGVFSQRSEYETL